MDGKILGVWGGLRPPHTPNFLPLPAIPKEPEFAAWMISLLLLRRTVCNMTNVSIVF